LLELRYEIVPYPLYSLDLDTLGFFVPKYKKMTCKKEISNYEVIDKTSAYFTELNKSHYMNRIKKIENR